MRNLLYAADGGASICAGGSNPFGLANAGSISQACLDYIQAETHDYTKLNQTIFRGQSDRWLFAMPAGDLRFALTLDSRKNEFEFDRIRPREPATSSARCRHIRRRLDVSQGSGAGIPGAAVA
jgi:hypothetical protein